MSNTPYIGRFAPSPSGPLHFGSLVCALASYFDAKKNLGKWLIRIEDIDPPREQEGASDLILSTLESHGLHWDGPVIYQSENSDSYYEILDHLKTSKLAYPCNCSRKRLHSLGLRYDGHCRNAKNVRPPFALRLKVSDLPEPFKTFSSTINFEDLIRGSINEDLELSGDFVIHRKDGLFAYQLAVVVDDINQHISHVVRGNDLLDTTAKQIFLFKLLNQSPPHYAHIPVITGNDGYKLSKQNHAPAINQSCPVKNILLAMQALKIDTSLLSSDMTLTEILKWGIKNWDMASLKKTRSVAFESLKSN